MGFVPLGDKPYTPSYYKLVGYDLETGERTKVDVVDLIHLNVEEPLVAFAIKYLFRAGMKDGEEYLKDVTKAVECLRRILLVAAAYHEEPKEDAIQKVG